MGPSPKQGTLREQLAAARPDPGRHHRGSPASPLTCIRRALTWTERRWFSRYSSLPPSQSGSFLIKVIIPCSNNSPPDLLACQAASRMSLGSVTKGLLWGPTRRWVARALKASDSPKAFSKILPQGREGRGVVSCLLTSWFQIFCS